MLIKLPKYDKYEIADPLPQPDDSITTALKQYFDALRSKEINSALIPMLEYFKGFRGITSELDIHLFYYDERMKFVAPRVPFLLEHAKGMRQELFKTAGISHPDRWRMRQWQGDEFMNYRVGEIKKMNL